MSFRRNQRRSRRACRDIWRVIATTGCLLSVSVPARAQDQYTFRTFAGQTGIGTADGTGSAARFNSPNGVAVGSDGTVYVADTSNSSVRKITPAGVVSTLAGLPGTCGQADGAGSAARFCQPAGVAVDAGGTVYVADSGAQTIRKITPAGSVSTLAGAGFSVGSADGAGSAARFWNPGSVAVDSAGSVYVADSGNNTIRKITSAGVVTTFVGLAGSPGSSDGTGAAARFFNPSGVAVDSAGTVLVADSANSTVRSITSAGAVSTLAGLAGSCGQVDGNGTAVRLCVPDAVTVDASGTVYVADRGGSTIRLITPGRVVRTLAGAAFSPGSADGTGSEARFSFPRGVAVDSAGTVFVADPNNQTIRAITPAGLVSTLAGAAFPPGSVDGTGAVARFNLPSGVAVDRMGTVYVADLSNHTIRKITPGGAVTTLAGSAGSRGSTDGTGTVARFINPSGVAVDNAGTVYVADSNNDTIRKITPESAVSTLAGLAGSLGSIDGTGRAARFQFPQDIAVDSAGTVYVADSSNHTIRKITPAGVVTLLAGLAGNVGSADGAGSVARFSSPTGVKVDGSGIVYVADTNNHTIRKITPAGVVSTLAGLAGVSGQVDDAGSAARFCAPQGLAADANGTVYVADTACGTIRKITPAGVVSTVAGGRDLGSTDGTGAAVRFYSPRGVAVDASGTLYVADVFNNTIRLGGVLPSITTQPVHLAVTPGQNAQFTVTARGMPTPALQWQVSTNSGASWSELTDSPPYSGVTTATLTVTAATVGLSRSRYRAVAANSVGSETSNGATLIVSVSSSPPGVSLDRTSLPFGATNSGLPSPGLTSKTSDQLVRMTLTGPGVVTWTATANQPWVTVSPASGSTVDVALLTVGVRFDSSLPVSGTVNGSVTVTLTGAGNAVGPINVSLRTTPSGTTSATFGTIDTPLEGTTGVTGSIAVTGWAIDDVEVVQVQIFRDPVAGEGTARIFIGNAVFVEGARPDVAGLNPTKPRNTQAGWGYLMLTNFLPNQGNGTFKLYAMAINAAGQTTLLGTRTITCSNSTATRPFGAIDTPAPGEVISGTSYNNFGWVLMRGPALAYPPYGTVFVLIDGTISGSPTFWTNRLDLTALFPAAIYPGIPYAAGVFTFDTTKLANGGHSIAWVVTSNTGQTDGIGSRFFTVANGGGLHASNAASAASEFSRSSIRQKAEATSLSLEAPAVMTAPRAASAMSLADEVTGALLDRTPIAGRRGYDIDAPLQTFSVAPSGHATMRGEELDRFEVRLKPDTTQDAADGGSYTGYTRVGGELGPLPIGSHLDPETGVFTWLAGPGFVHTYDLVFVRWTDGRAVARQEVRLVLNPKGSNRVGPQVVIDTPAAQAEVAQPFVVAGWAIDRDAHIDTGVETLHVWAYATTGGDPIFVGATAYGGARPDVGAIFGDQFTNSGYGLIVDTLPPGTYDLAVFAWSAVKGGFVPAKVVRVTVR